MQPLQLFATAFSQNEWLAQRQSLISANIANVNTPGYKAKDIASFEEVMNASGAVTMAVTNPRHMQVDGGALGSANAVEEKEPEVFQSGNDVSLEKEFLKSADVSRQYTLNAQIIKTFNRMLLSVTKA
jgi:flagellar basal-body rod protein FlgB